MRGLPIHPLDIEPWREYLLFMPYTIVKKGDQYCVITQGKADHVHGCHPSRAKAVTQLKALYANADPASEKSKEKK